MISVDKLLSRSKPLALMVACLCITGMFLILFVGMVSAERQVDATDRALDGYILENIQLKNTLEAQQELIAAYQAQNAALALALDQAVETLQAIANGPYTRAEIQQMIDQVARVIQDINKTLSSAESEEIGRLLVTNAVAAEVDPWLLLAMAITESHCRPDIRGGSGEYGMMQVMPGTGKWIAGKLGYTNWTPEDLWDLDTNIQFAAYYLRISIREFGGDISKGVLAYNRGSSGAREWLQENPASDHRYVRKVMANYRGLSG